MKKQLKAIWGCPQKLNETRFMWVLLYRRLKRIEEAIRRLELK